MAVPVIVWRNPKFEQPPRRWSKLEREHNRNLYVVLESVSVRENTWEGLPSLEMITCGAKAESAAATHPAHAKKMSLWGRV
jgi:hypothetical protein